MQRRPCHLSIALSIMLWFIPCQMCSKCCYYLLWFLTSWTPIMMVNLKLARGLSSSNCENLTGLCDSFCLYFLPDLWQIWNFNFPKVVWQHCLGAVENNTWILLEISFSFQWWKKFEHRLTFDQVTTMSLVAPFFGTQCTSPCRCPRTLSPWQRHWFFLTTYLIDLPFPATW